MSIPSVVRSFGRLFSRSVVRSYVTFDPCPRQFPQKLLSLPSIHSLNLLKIIYDAYYRSQ